MNRDTWDTDAAKRLTAHIVRRAADFAPDSHYDATTRRVIPGPTTMHIAGVLKRWADMWAQDMREARTYGFDVDQDAQWAANMREADAEISRYLASCAAAA